MRALAARPRPQRASRALVVEALALMVVLCLSGALVTQVLSTAARASARAAETARACAVASGAAERFCADPSSVPAESEEEGLRVSVSRSQERTAAGILWRATVEVAPAADPGAEPLCSLETARFEPWGVV